MKLRRFIFDTLSENQGEACSVASGASQDNGTVHLSDKGIAAPPDLARRRPYPDWDKITTKTQ
jgi:hypothetical protein